METSVGSKVGVMKVAAKRLGMGFEQYAAMIAEGLKGCFACGTWKPRSEFCSDVSRCSGLDTKCSSCRRVRVRKQRRMVAPSVKEQQAASSAVSYAVATGRFPAIDTLQCHKCGGDAEHYHHHNGYAVENRLDVIPLCRSCHIKEHWE